MTHTVLFQVSLVRKVRQEVLAGQGHRVPREEPVSLVLLDRPVELGGLVHREELEAPDHKVLWASLDGRVNLEDQEPQVSPAGPDLKVKQAGPVLEVKPDSRVQEVRWVSLDGLVLKDRRDSQASVFSQF